MADEDVLGSAPGDAPPDRPRRGRPVTAPGPTRGRPADRTLIEPLEIEGQPRLTRRGRTGTEANVYEIPTDMKKPGWDYEWKMHACTGMPASASDMLAVHEAGWRAVLGRDMPAMVPPGGDLNKQIERDGLGLYTRPQRLTDEARQEDYRIAQEQQAAKLAAAHTNVTTDPRMPTSGVTLDIQGEVGTYRVKG